MQAQSPTAHELLSERFRQRISPYIVHLAAQLAPADSEALLRQFTPDEQELTDPPGFNEDPLHEDDADIHPFADVVHKYPNKLLYLTTDECPVYCRYCTRKRKTLLSAGHSATDPQQIAAYLESHPTINEVIFSGGDPLMMSAPLFAERARIFLSLQSIHYLRLHTRALTTSPKLLSSRFLSLLGDLRRDFPEKQITFVLHVNTAAELSTETRTLVETLRTMGIPCYAQTVLLRGVNADANKLAELCQKLVKNGIQPYYLHQLDRVTGSAHFEIADEDALRIYNGLKMAVPRYMLPQLVRDTKQGKYSL